MNKGYTLTLIYAVLLAFFQVVSKKSLDAGWGKQPGMFTAVTRLMAVAMIAPFVFTQELNLSPFWWVPVILTGILNVGIQYSDVKAKSLDDVSLVAPIATTTPAFVIFTSMVLLDEYPTTLGYVGIVMMVIGTYIMNIQAYVKKRSESTGKTSWRDWLAPFIQLSKSWGVRFALLAAVLATVSLPLDAMAYRKANLPLVAVCIFSIAASGSLVIAYVSGETKQKKHNPYRLLVLPSVFLALAIIAGSAAFYFTLTPYIGVLRRLSIPVTIILAYIMVGEKMNFRERLVGGTLMAVGATLIAVSDN